MAISHLWRFSRVLVTGRAQATLGYGRALSSLSRPHPYSFTTLPRILSRQLTTTTSNTAASTDSQPTSVAEERQPKPFKDLAHAISARTLDALTGKAFNLKTMTTVQEEVLSLLPQLAEPYDPSTPGKDGHPRDLLVRAKTGTGKTLGFLIPAVEARLNALEAAGRQAVADAGLTEDRHLADRARVKYARECVGTLIISPTRELATQIANEAIRLTQHVPGFEVRLFVGGENRGRQMRDWMKGRRDIVVATPGRLRDVMSTEPEVMRGLSQTQIFVLDEADTLLDMGFRDDIEAIGKELPPPPQRQTFMFSATVSNAIQQTARSILDKNHKYINTITEEDSPVHAHIPQYSTVLPNGSQQLSHVMNLIAHDQLTNPEHSKVIVFLPTTKMTQLFSTIVRELSVDLLPAKSTTVLEIHSKRTQDQRSHISQKFRMLKTGHSILVTSDVSARGVDYPGVTRVIQVGVPQSSEQYIHRVGRTGRAGTNGRGDFVVLPWEAGFLSWKLTEVPLKNLTTNQLQQDVLELSAKADANPRPDHAPPKTPVSFRKPARYTPVVSTPAFMHPIVPRMERMDQVTSQLLSKFDAEAIRETFTSLLGYYVSRTADLRVNNSVVLEGLRKWTVEACGLEVPPFVSESFLAKLGMMEPRTRSFGRPSNSTSRDSSRGRDTRGSREGREHTWGNRRRRDSFDGEAPARSEWRDNANESRPRRYGQGNGGNENANESRPRSYGQGNGGNRPFQSRSYQNGERELFSEGSSPQRRERMSYGRR